VTCLQDPMAAGAREDEDHDDPRLLLPEAIATCVQDLAAAGAREDEDHSEPHLLLPEVAPPCLQPARSGRGRNTGTREVGWPATGSSFRDGRLGMKTAAISNR
jgi:hypothetical protein